MVSHYYELTGKSRQIVDNLEKLYYVHEWIETLRINKIAKKFLCFLLLFPMVPLTLLARVIRVLVREKIPTEVFEQERKKWNEISCYSQPELYHQTITKKLITRRINPNNYTKFLVIEYEPKRGGGYFCVLDGLYRLQATELVRALEDHKKVLICMKVDISFASDFHKQLPDYPKLKKHIADNLFQHPDITLTQHDFQQCIDQNLDVLFFDHVSGNDFSQQISLAVCYRVPSYGH